MAVLWLAVEQVWIKGTEWFAAAKMNLLKPLFTLYFSHDFASANTFPDAMFNSDDTNWHIHIYKCVLKRLTGIEYSKKMAFVWSQVYWDLFMSEKA